MSFHRLRSVLSRYVRGKLRGRANTAQSLQDVFNNHYENNVWGSEESRSGPGSTEASTAVLVSLLPRLFQELGVKSMLDLPCGDFNWMRKVDLSQLRYIGADIVPELTAKLRKEYGSPSIAFEVLDVTTSPLPQVDLVFCRDCLIHLSYANAAKALRNIVQSGATYLLTTDFPKGINRDISSGDFYHINLTKPPFCLPAPVARYSDSASRPEEKDLALWRIKDFQASPPVLARRLSTRVSRWYDAFEAFLARH